MEKINRTANEKVYFIFIGCSLKNKFIETSNVGYVSTCGYFSTGQRIISDKQIYIANQDFLDIYMYKNSRYAKIAVFSLANANLPLVPIESCNDKWCKIYYPCDDVECFVKKDEIIKHDN